MFWRLYQVLSQSFPPPPTWSVDDMPNQSGRVHLVTGGAAGIGLETTKALLMKDATVYIATRNRRKAEAAIALLKEETGNEAHFLELDLASLESVKRAATEFLAKETALHVLYNNAGVLFTDMKLMTVDGYDLQFGTNVLGHFYLTRLLMPALIAGQARVVNVSSVMPLILTAPTSSFDYLTDGPDRRKLSLGKYRMYGISKLGNILHAKELHRRYAQDGIVATAVNPGILKTDLYKTMPSRFRRWIYDRLLYPPPFGAITQLYAGTAPEGASMGGQFLVPWARIGPTSVEASDADLARRLWDWLEEQVRFHETQHS
ncbi:NAD(P)-binding protein [Exidia glandulosa HHB12029]|uniref:NAD(P)-binding protein n=1 Tax=Exidia glandulosa HHB12029 TaxID=1314781 RepID=A0A165ZZ80_EXIGL|nr:NAD(P)-binding protein [Exidia glandulosa HHB12029]KZV87059.1 NAD(P)-binding protein [Exidia glandulosa HHB12029]